MLHEILLSLSNLSGESPLLHSISEEAGRSHEQLSSLLSPSELALVSSLTKLSNVHRKVASHASAISSSHPSAICRAIAVSINATHLARFQTTIREVEKSILAEDAGFVGAYGIVPLSGVVGKFEPWTRKLEWLWKVVLIMLSTAGGTSSTDNLAIEQSTCSSADILDRLREELQTGYPDIEEISRSLVGTAETAWLRQLSTWVLYGRLPSFGASDFFIQPVNENITNGEPSTYFVDPAKAPAFLNADTASSILFIGRSLSYVRAKGINAGSISSTSMSPELALSPVHLKHLAELSFPIASARLSSAIDAIRLSLSMTTLRKLLPRSKIIETLTVLREYFLLGHGEFAVALITEAETKLSSRSRRGKDTSQRTEKLDQLVLKDGEIKAVLARTWAALSSGESHEDSYDTTLERAHELILLSIDATPKTPKRSSKDTEKSETETVFNDFLLGSPIRLQLRVPPLLDLLLTLELMETYSRMHSYLLSIRRAHLRLTGLWKNSSLRREHPAPLGPPYSCKASGGQLLRDRRTRSNRRAKDMRRLWARSSTALFLLAELGDYFQGDILKQSWADFQSWLESETKPEDENKSVDHSDMQLSGTFRNLELKEHGSRPSTRHSRDGGTNSRRLHDPETIARAHNSYLESLVDSLLLSDAPFTQDLRKLLQEIDNLIACVNRLQTVWQNIDLETDEGVVDTLANYQDDQQEASADLELASKTVAARVRTLVTRLRDLDTGRGNAAHDNSKRLGDHEYTPLRPGGVDRLLMKLDFGNLMNHDGEHLVDEVGSWSSIRVLE
jgi:hypothetical protein